MMKLAKVDEENKPLVRTAIQIGQAALNIQAALASLVKSNGHLEPTLSFLQNDSSKTPTPMDERTARNLFYALTGGGDISKLKSCSETFQTAMKDLSENVAKYDNSFETLLLMVRDIRHIMAAISVIPAIAEILDLTAAPQLSVTVGEAMKILCKPIDQDNYDKFTKTMSKYLRDCAYQFVPKQLSATMDFRSNGEFGSELLDRGADQELYTMAARGALTDYNVRQVTTARNLVIAPFLWSTRGEADLALVIRAIENEDSPESQAAARREKNRSKGSGFKDLITYPPPAAPAAPVAPVVAPAAAAALQSPGRGGRRRNQEPLEAQPAPARPAPAQPAAPAPPTEHDLDVAALQRMRRVAPGFEPIRPVACFTDLNKEVALSPTAKVEDFRVNGVTMVNWIMEAYSLALRERAAVAMHARMWPHKSSVTGSPAPNPFPKGA